MRRDDYLPSVFGSAVLRVRVSAALDRRRVQDGPYLRREIICGADDSA